MHPRPAPALKSAFLAALLIAIQFLVPGCGGGGTATPGPANAGATVADPSGTGTVVVRFSSGTTKHRAAEPTAYRCTGTDASGRLLYGPVERSLESLGGSQALILKGVPFEVTSLLIEPLVDGQPVDAIAHPVSLGPNSSLVVIEGGLASFSPPSSLSIVPASPPSIAIGGRLAFVALAAYPDGSRHDVSTAARWSSSPEGLLTLSAAGVATGLKGGPVTVSATLDGVTGKVDASVSPDATAVVVTSSVNPTVSGQAVTFKASITANTGTPTGTVTFMDGQAPLGTATLTDGTASLGVSSLGAGTHSITAVYAGNAAFATSTSPVFTQTVDRDEGGVHLGSSASPSVFGQAVTLTALVTAKPPGSGTATGVVTFYDGTTVLASNIAIYGEGQATFTTSTLSVGSHSITAHYEGDGNFTPSTSPALEQSVVRSPVNAVVTPSVNPSVFGQLVTFTAQVAAAAPGSGTPTGSVTFYDGTSVLADKVSLDGNGRATYATSRLEVGSHPITVTYTGDTNFVDCTSPACGFSVALDPGGAHVTSSANPSVYGQSVTFTATVTATEPGSGTPTGTVVFYDGTTPLSASVGLDDTGKATCNTSALSVGSHSITVQYSGDSHHSPSTSPALAQTVNQDAGGAHVSSSANPSVFGQPVTFTALVTATPPGSGTPTGSVTFYRGSQVIGANIPLDVTGQATLSLSSLPVGDSSITVAYGGDTNFSPCTSPALTQTVGPAVTTTQVTPSFNPVVFGQAVAFTARVAAVAPASGIPTGKVTFYDGATVLAANVSLDSNGQATYATSALSVGSHSVTASYAGDGSFSPSTSPSFTQTVDRDAGGAQVTSSLNPSVFGQSITFTATVVATPPGSGSPSGTVTFYDGTTALSTALPLDGAGQATLSTSALAGGAHAITVRYSGDDNFAASTSPALSQTVDRDAGGAHVSSSTNPTVYGQSVTFTATVTAGSSGIGIPTGTVTFYEGTTALTSTTLDGTGQATCSTSTLAVGDHSITVKYAGDGNFSACTSPAITQTVSLAVSATQLSASTASVTYGQSVTFTAHVTAVAPGSGTPTGTVTFMNGASQMAANVPLNGSGTATFSTSALPVGSHTSLRAIYSGDARFSASTSPDIAETVSKATTTTTLTGSGSPSTVEGFVTFTATVTAVAPSSAVPTGSVRFCEGSTTLGTGSLNGSGVATFSTPTLSTGSHSIKAVYDGTANFTGSTSSTLTQDVDQACFVTTMTSGFTPVYRVTPSSGPYQYTIPLGSPTGLAFDNSGNLWVGNTSLSDGYALFCFAPGGGAPTAGKTIYSAQPWGLSLNPWGNIVVADVNTWGLGLLNPASGSYQGLVANVSHPVSFTACDASGNTYVSSQTYGGAVYKVSANGSSIQTIVAGGSSDDPSGVAVDASGRVYVSWMLAGSVTRVGDAVPFVTGLPTPMGGLAFDSAGNLFAGCGTYVYKITPAGVASLYAMLPYRVLFLTVR